MPPKALLIRPGHAIGDAVFVTPIPRLLAGKGYEVHIACMSHNFEVFLHNPYISELIPLPATGHLSRWVKDFAQERSRYELVLTASGHVEVGLLYRTDTAWGTIPDINERRTRAAGVNYMDLILEKLGFEERGLRPEFYFSPEEVEQMTAVRDRLQADRTQLILWQWDGSSRSKQLVWAPWYLQEVLKRKPQATHYVFTPDPDMQALIPKHPKVYNAWGASGIRNTIQLCAVADLVIGPESFMVNAAGAFETPEIIFFSHSAPDNLARYYQNCYAVVPSPEVACHPCYLIHVDFRKVWHPEKRAIARLYEKHCQVYSEDFPYRCRGYKCCWYLPHANVVDIIIKILKGKARQEKKGRNPVKVRTATAIETAMAQGGQ